MAKLQTISADAVKGAQSETQDVVIKGKVAKVKKERKEPKHYISHHHGQGKTRNNVVVKKGTEVLKVERKLGDQMVAEQGWSYGKRSEWRAIRDGVSPA